jgi:hypothetical protein
MRRPSWLKLAWHAYILVAGLVGLVFWGLAIFDLFDPKFDAEQIGISLGGSALFVAAGWSHLRLYRAARRAWAEAQHGEAG